MLPRTVSLVLFNSCARRHSKDRRRSWRGCRPARHRRQRRRILEAANLAL